MLDRSAILYRFPVFIPSCLSVDRYATMPPRDMERPWIPAIRRLMAAKGFNQRKLSDASGVRPNTLSDLLAGSNSQIETLEALAKALDAPLWALFCGEHEFAIFTERAKQHDVARDADQRDADVAARVLEGLKPYVLKAVKGEPIDVPAAVLKPRRVVKSR